MSRISKLFIAGALAVVLVGAGYSAQYVQGGEFLGYVEFFAVDSDAASSMRIDPILNGGTVVYEGATKDAFENYVSAADVTADVDLNYPLNNAVNGAIVVSSLVTNSAHIANSVWMESDKTCYEGATANNFETCVTPVDPTVDRTITIPDASVNVGRIQVTCKALLVADMIDQACFIADRVYTVLRIDEVHVVKESSGTLTIMPRKAEGTEAASSGQALLSAAFDATATVETVLNGSLTSTGADLILAAGDRLVLDFVTDVAGELSGVVVTFTLDPS